MSDNQMIPLDQFGPIAPEAKNSPVDVSKFTAGIGMSWPTLTLKGKTWGWRFRGESRIYDAPNPAAGGAIMPVQHLDVVIVDTANRISKVYYKEGWKDGDRQPPTCWSADGITPDEGVGEKQNPTCRACRHNVFGSSIGDAGQKGKACSDNKRLAVVTTRDLQNTDFGGPFMLRLPPGSFANYTTYVSVMSSRGFPPFAVVTRLMFEPQVAHPKVTLMPVRPLTSQEMGIILAHQHNPRTSEMLNDKAVAAFAEAEVDYVAPVAELPSADATPPAGGGWTAPTPASPSKSPATASSGTADTLTQPSNVVQMVPPAPPPTPQKTPEQLRIEALEAQLAAARAPAPEPVPAKTPEQLRIEALEAQLAAAQAPKTRKARSKPVSPPTSPDGTVTASGNGVDTSSDEPPPGDVGNAIANRIERLTGKTPA